MIRKLFMLSLVTLAAFCVVAQNLPNRRNGLLNRGNRPGAQRPNQPANNAPTPTNSKTVAPGGRSIEFNAAPVEMVFKVYGELVDKTVLKDPSAPAATITLQPKQGQELSDEDKILAIETVLEMNGIHLEPYGEKFVRALPRGTVRKDGIPLIMDPNAELEDTTRVVSMMLTFKNIALEEAQKALEGLKSDKGVLNVYERSNSILVTDTSANINRMREILKEIDLPTEPTDQVFVYDIQYASAADIKTALEAIVQDSQKELEKQGKNAQNRPSPTPTPTMSRIIGRNQPQQPASTPNLSLVTAVSDADRGMIRGHVLILSDERSNKLIIITSAANMATFEKVIKALDIETTPDTVVKVFRLKYADSEDVADMINDLIGNAPSSKSSSKGNQNAKGQQQGGGGKVNLTTGSQRKSANQRTGDAKAGELSKENTTVLSDKRINGIVVMTNKELLNTVEEIIEKMDVKLSQVLIETCIIEVSLGDDLSTGVNWAQPGDKQINENDVLGTTKTMLKDATGRQLYWTDDSRESTTWKSTDDSGNPLTAAFSLTEMYGDTRQGYLNGAGNAAQYMLGGGGSSGSAASILNALAGVGTNLLSSVSPAGSGLNWYFKSDALNIAAVIQASKSDSRTKYLASPVVMTLDNKEAVINATEMNYLLKGFTSSGNSYSTIAVPDYEQKELGIEIKVTPKINPNGTVMLEVTTKYTQQSGSQTIKYATGGSSGQSSLADVSVPLTATREMESDVLLENMQTVVFGGLVKTFKSEEETGIPLLKDIPYIGKWLFGSVTQKEKRNELLVFMTPYVMTDGEAAQAEAIRRKKTMSDPRPWEDHGWSASNLADPVSKKEQMRRIKDEWKKQDEERKTNAEIEQLKLERAKKLEAMSKEERDRWLELHKEELKEEEQKAFEEKMLDKDSQDELRKLAEQIRAKKLKEAETEIKKGEELTHALNERAKMDAEKAEKQAEKAPEAAVPEPSAPETPAAEVAPVIKRVRRQSSSK